MKFLQTRNLVQFTSLLLLAGVINLKAANTIHPFNTATGNWSVSGNWFSGGVPNTAGDIVDTRITGYVVTLDQTATVGVVRDTVATSGAYTFTVSSDGSHSLTLDGTGLTAGNNPLGNAGHSAIGSVRNLSTVNIYPSLVLANTDCDIGCNNGGSGTTTVNVGQTANTASLTATTPQTINLMLNSGHSGSGLNIYDSIGASGSLIAINNIGAYQTANIYGNCGPNISTITQNGNSTMNISGNITGGSIVVTSGTLTLSGSANTYSGSTAVNGGILKLGVANAIPSGSSVSVAGTLNLNGKSDAIDGLSGAGIIDATIAGTINLSIGNNNSGGTFSGAIQNTLGTLSLTKTGSGTEILSGVSTYTGGTTVNGGSLVVNNATGSGTGSGTVTVASGARLSGAGAIVGATTINANGTLAGGVNGVGTLAFNNNLTLNAASTNAFAVTSAGGASNKVAVAGALAANNSLIRVTSGTALVPGTYTLFTYGSISGSFNPTVLFDVAPAHAATLVDNGSGHINLVVHAGPTVVANADLNVAPGASLTLALPGKYVRDADGDALTITGNTSATNGSVSIDNLTNIIYTASASPTGTSDSFVCTVSDAYGDTVTVTVSVVINTGSTGQSYNQLSAVTDGSGDRVMKYLGIPGYQYALDWKTNLPDAWTPVLTNTAGANGVMLFTNTPSVTGTDFYRTRWVH